jgi:purine-nucleoside phosphorylase
MQISAIDLDAIASKIPLSADVALILGSGLGGFAEKLENAIAVKTGELPGYPVSTVAGHAGQIVVGAVGQTRVMAFQGRVHQYEGYAPSDVVVPVRLAHKLGAKVLIVTNASGAFTTRFHAGDLLLIDDHINLQFRNPLRGPVMEKESRWPDMYNCYDEKLKLLAEDAAMKLHIPLKRGTLAAVLGPNYETPAEVNMLAGLGADAGCMSTVPEVIAAAALGMKVLGISCVTNSAAGLNPIKLSHEDVQNVAQEAADKFERLLRGILFGMRDEGWGMK